MFRIIMKMGQGAEGSDGMGQQDRQRQQQGEGEEGGEREEKEEEPLWLGLDLSTQSLTAAVLRGDGVGGAFNEPVVLESINYEVPLYFCSYDTRIDNMYLFHAQSNTSTDSVVVAAAHQMILILPRTQQECAILPGAQQCSCTTTPCPGLVLHSSTLCFTAVPCAIFYRDSPGNMQHSRPQCIARCPFVRDHIIGTSIKYSGAYQYRRTAV